MPLTRPVLWMCLIYFIKALFYSELDKGTRRAGRPLLLYKDVFRRTLKRHPPLPPGVTWHQTEQPGEHTPGKPAPIMTPNRDWRTLKEELVATSRSGNEWPCRAMASIYFNAYLSKQWHTDRAIWIRQPMYHTRCKIRHHNTKNCKENYVKLEPNGINIKENVFFKVLRGGLVFCTFLIKKHC